MMTSTSQSSFPHHHNHLLQSTQEDKDFPVMDTERDRQRESNKNKSISMTLNGTRLSLNSRGRWELQSADLDLATLEIERLLTEKQLLAETLGRAVEQIEDLQQEVRDLNKVKSTTLQMLMKETEKRLELEEQIEEYKHELKESYRVIVELRKYIEE